MSCQNYAGTVRPCLLQVKADVYEKIDKELLEFVEDVLLNRCENATERLLEYAGTLDPKSKPTAVRKKGQVQCVTFSWISKLLPASWLFCAALFCHLCRVAYSMELSMLRLLLAT